jgi:lysyl-tRNA synthetase class 1
MGVGASGLPHIGSLGDAARSFAVTMALRDQGFKSELVAFSDDKDGLRKVPAGFPKSLQKYLGYSVTDIPDPFKCHNSYGQHMRTLLLEALDESSIEYNFVSAENAYKEGWFNEEIKTILINAKQVGEIVKSEVGQERYTEALPYFPICGNCGRIYTTTAQEFLPKEGKILYICDGMEIKGKWLEGCQHKGETDYRDGEGKLSWKSEFAVRWKALSIRFEAYGKDIEDSVRINDRICREILHYEPPMHARYEMFLDKSGRKISKSAGNVFTPQVWFRYGSPQSLVLLMLKRFTGTRELSVTDIPYYMNEFDDLEDTYFGKKKIVNKKELAKLTGLYKYCWWLNPSSKPSIHVPYNLMAFLVKMAPKDREEEFVAEKLQEYGYLQKNESLNKDLRERLRYAVNWVKDFEEIKETRIELSKEDREALTALIKVLNEEDEAETIQNAIFETAKNHGIKPSGFFKKLYLILIGIPRGPRMGAYIVTMGKQNVINAVKKILDSS